MNPGRLALFRGPSTLAAVLLLCHCGRDEGGTGAIDAPDARGDRALSGGDSGAEVTDGAPEAGDAGQPYIDPTKLGPSCGPDAGVCPEEMTCGRFSAVNAAGEFTCVRGPRCEALVCPPGYVCLTNDKDTPDVYCYAQ